MPPPAQRRAFGIPREDDPELLDVTTMDGRSVVLPRAAAEAAGVAVRPRIAQAPAPSLSITVPEAPPVDPAVMAALTERAGVADAPPVPVPAAPLPTSGGMLDDPRFNAPPPATPDEAGLRSALEAIQPNAAAAPAPPVAPAAPVVAVPPQIANDPGAAAAFRSFQAPHNNPAPFEGEVFVDRSGRRHGAAAAPAPAAPRELPPGVRRAGAPLGREQVDPFEAFGSDDPVVAALRNRPADAEPLVPEDFRQQTGLERQIQRIDRDRDRAQQVADANAAAAIDREDILAEQAAEQERIAADRDATLARAQSQYMAAFQEARSATVNPSRLFQNGGGVAIAIATALGSLGSQLTGGENQALGIIERAIDRDIRAQTTNQGNAQRTVQNARSFIDITRQQFSDEAAAATAARSLAWDQVAQRLDRQVASVQAGAARDEAAALAEQARAQAMAAAREALAAEQQRQLDQREQQARTRRLDAQAARDERRAGGGGGGARRGTGVVPGEVIGTEADPVVQQAIEFLGMNPTTAAEQAANTTGGSRSGRNRLLNRIGEAQERRGRLAQGFELAPGRTLDDTQIRSVNGLVAADREFNAAIGTIREYAGRLREGGLLGYAWEQARGRAGFGSRDYQTINHAIDVIRTQFRNINQSGNSLGAQTLAEHDFPNLTQNVSLDSILANVEAARDVKHRYVTAVLSNLGIRPGAGGGEHGEEGGESAELPEGVRRQ